MLKKMLKKIFGRSNDQITLEKEYRILLTALYEEQLNDYKASSQTEEYTTMMHILAAAILMLRNPNKDPRHVEDWVTHSEKVSRRR